MANMKYKQALDRNSLRQAFDLYDEAHVGV